MGEGRLRISETPFQRALELLDSVTGVARSRRKYLLSYVRQLSGRVAKQE
jgi:hypothetical protein